MINLFYRLYLLILTFSLLILGLTNETNAHLAFLPKLPKGLPVELPVDLGSSNKESTSKKSSTSTATKGLSLLSTAVSTQSDEEEIAAGEAVAALYLGAAPLVESEEVSSYVQSLGMHIAAQTERAELPWSF
ncbi:MAG: hypothetical protein VXZ45_02020, partial [Verrucomicrobiota bacterium]|nr:hypothetical protein [Verrucomicrobiota bacterium]